MDSSTLILLIEDNEDDAFLIRRALQQAGIKDAIHLAEDGQQAIDYLNGDSKFADRQQFPLPDLILLDLKLPRVMGIDVLKWIRVNPALRPAIVVVLTSSTEDTDADAAYRQGANSFVVKPGSPDKFEALAKCFREYWFQWNRLPRPSS